jgi:hypothetical protein
VVASDVLEVVLPGESSGEGGQWYFDAKSSRMKPLAATSLGTVGECG